MGWCVTNGMRMGAAGTPAEVAVAAGTVCGNWSGMLRRVARVLARYLLLIAIGAPAAALAAPLITASTYLGGSTNDDVRELGVDGAGNIYVSGVIGSANFPGIASTAFTNAGQGLIYAMRLDPNAASVQYVTPVGAAYADVFADPNKGLLNDTIAYGFAVDRSGGAYVAAYANATAFPSGVLPYARIGGKFLYKLDAAGRVAYAFALDPAIRSVRAVAVDASGNAYITGNAGPGLQTTAGAAFATSTGAPYLVKVDASGGSPVYATYLSQPGQRPYTAPSPHASYDWQTTPLALAVDAAGNAYITGQAGSHFAATPGAANFGDTTHQHTFVAKLNAAGTALLFVARLGNADADRGTSLAVASDGAVVVAGKTLDYIGFPIFFGFQSSVELASGSAYVDREIGYVARLSPDVGAIVFSSKLPTAGGNLELGTNFDRTDLSPVRVAIDAAGSIWITGRTSPTRVFPSVAPLQTTAQGPDAFLIKASADGRQRLMATVLGGNNEDAGTAIVADGFDGIVFAGKTLATDFPVVHSLQGGLGSPTQPYEVNGFVTRISDVGTPIALNASANPSTAGQAIELAATVAGARDNGTVEFREGANVIGMAGLAGGVAKLGVLLPSGIHVLTATYRGTGPFDGYPSPVLHQIVNLACN